jgi:hypothetical protein
MYRVILNDRLVCETDWPVMAQAAWNRAARDRDSAQHGGVAVLEKDSRVLARVQPETRRGHRWPDDEAPEATWHDTVKALLLLLRADNWSSKDVAEAMTSYGLPTSRARIDALRGSTPGKRTEVMPAEVVLMIYAIVNAYRSGQNAESGGENGA